MQPACSHPGVRGPGAADGVKVAGRVRPSRPSALRLAAERSEPPGAGAPVAASCDDLPGARRPGKIVPRWVTAGRRPDPDDRVAWPHPRIGSIVPVKAVVPGLGAPRQACIEVRTFWWEGL